MDSHLPHKQTARQARLITRRLLKYPEVSIGGLSRITQVPYETFKEIISGKSKPPRGMLAKLHRFERLLMARKCLTELEDLHFHRVEIARAVGLCKETITNIFNDDFWSVAEDTLQDIRHLLFEYKAALFESFLSVLEITPLETSGRPTNTRGWRRRTRILRHAVLDSYKGQHRSRRRADFQGILASVGPEDDRDMLLIIWAHGKDSKTMLQVLRHEANELDEFASRKLQDLKKKETISHKAIMRICK